MSRRIVQSSVTMLALLAVIAGPTVPASADHLPLDACSPSGDVCKSVRRVDEVRRLRIMLAADYFERYRLCVTGPGASPVCHTYRIRDLGATFGSSIAWRANFPFEGRGEYKVVWKFIGGGWIGRALGFHVDPDRGSGRGATRSRVRP